LSYIALLNNRFLSRLKKHPNAGLFLAAVVSFLTTCLYVTPSLRPESHGEYYALLSLNPFDPGNPNSHRILTPLIAYLLGLRGGYLVILNYAFLVLFLYTIARTLYKKTLDFSLVFATLLLFSLSMPSMFTVYYSGYPDSTSYFLFSVLLTETLHFSLFVIFAFLSLLNHEMSGFFLPFFWSYQRWRDKASKTLQFLGLVMPFALYIPVYILLSSHNRDSHFITFYIQPLIEQSLFFWLRQQGISMLMGIFSAFRFGWFLVFFAGMVATRKRDIKTATRILAPVLISFSLTFFAVDTSRMISFAFPSLLFSLLYLYENYGQARTLHYLKWCALLNVLTPPIYVTSGGISLMRPTALALLRLAVN